MRVCILSLPNPFDWVYHLVDAFRQRAEVLTVGPLFDAPFLATWGVSKPPPWAKPSDIVTHLFAEVDLRSVLPQGYEPDLIVAISDFGRPLNPAMDSFRCPKVYLSIDTWQSPLDYVDAMQYDFVFAAQRAFVPRLRATGARHVTWLPLGCNPRMHHPIPVEKDCDIVFAGSIGSHVHNERRRLLDALRARYSVHIQQRVYGEAQSEVFARGRFAFNHAAVADLNMRVFEALGMGCLLLTNIEAERNGLLDLFVDGKHLLVYRDEAHLLELVDKYLADDAAREAIAQAGYEEVLARHTYLHRIDTILETVAAHVPGFPNIDPGPPPTGRDLLEMLPIAPGVVLDIGMRLQDPRPRLQALGAEALIGLGPVAPGAEPFPPWDQVHPWPLDTSLSEPAGAAVIENFSACQESPAEVIATAYTLLGEGGALLFRLTAREILALGLGQEVEAWNQWLRAQNLHLLELRSVNLPNGLPSFLFKTRKRTRTIAEVVDEGLAEITVDGKAIRDFVNQLPPGF